MPWGVYQLEGEFMFPFLNRAHCRIADFIKTVLFVE